MYFYNLENSISKSNLSFAALEWLRYGSILYCSLFRHSKMVINAVYRKCDEGTKEHDLLVSRDIGISRGDLETIMGLGKLGS